MRAAWCNLAVAFVSWNKNSPFFASRGYVCRHYVLLLGNGGGRAMGIKSVFLRGLHASPFWCCGRDQRQFCWSNGAESMLSVVILLISLGRGDVYKKIRPEPAKSQRKQMQQSTNYLVPVTILRYRWNRHSVVKRNIFFCLPGVDKKIYLVRPERTKTVVSTE